MDENEKKSFGKIEQFSCILSELNLPDHPSDEEQERRGEEEIKRARPKKTQNKHNLNHLARDLSLKKTETLFFDVTKVNTSSKTRNTKLNYILKSRKDLKILICKSADFTKQDFLPSNLDLQTKRQIYNLLLFFDKNTESGGLQDSYE